MKKSRLFFALSAAFVAAAVFTQWHGLLFAAALFASAGLVENQNHT